MTDILRWILSLAVTIIVILFAIANRASVPLVWSPVHPPVQIPLCAAVLGGAVLGFLAGALFIWLEAVGLRADRRRHKKKINELERRLESVPEASHDKV